LWVDLGQPIVGAGTAGIGAKLPSGPRKRPSSAADSKPPDPIRMRPKSVRVVGGSEQVKLNRENRFSALVRR
jgi:hypothetical protein